MVRDPLLWQSGTERKGARENILWEETIRPKEA